MFLIPPLASVMLLIGLWSADMLSRPRLTAVCVLLGVATQWFAPVYSALWVAALLLNVGLAVYLAIRLRLGW